jgi:hypothetical protein
MAAASPALSNRDQHRSTRRIPDPILLVFSKKQRSNFVGSSGSEHPQRQVADVDDDGRP